MYTTKTRIYLQDFLNNKPLNLTNGNYHHVIRVLRLKIGEYISIFNEIDGEYSAKICEITKSYVTLSIQDFIKSYKQSAKNCNLFFAPLKKDANDFVLEKSVELGVNSVTQVITNYTVNKPITKEKTFLKLKQATEQCGRLDIPLINNPMKLSDLLKSFEESNQNILWLNENKNGTEFYKAIKNLQSYNYNILIGPEGGFSNSEKNTLLNHRNIISTYFNGNILRADTAAISALSIVNLTN